jgi:hypothetical protein
MSSLSIRSLGHVAEVDLLPPGVSRGGPQSDGSAWRQSTTAFRGRGALSISHLSRIGFDLMVAFPTPHTSWAEPGGTAFQTHQIAVVQRARAHPHQDLMWTGPRVIA